jgi:hypothetical protein
VGASADGWRDNLVGLAENMASVVADNHTVASIKSADPDDLWVANARRKLETARQLSGDWDYTYPAHLLGPGAAAYPPARLERPAVTADVVALAGVGFPGPAGNGLPPERSRRGLTGPDDQNGASPAWVLGSGLRGGVSRSRALPASMPC